MSIEFLPPVLGPDGKLRETPIALVGSFDTPWRAYAAYCVAARKHQGEYARLYDYETMIEPGPQSLGNHWLGI